MLTKSLFPVIFLISGFLAHTHSCKIIDSTSKSLLDSQLSVCRHTLKMPALIPDEERCASIFIDTNGLVEDPCAVEKERVLVNPWTTEEKENFLDKFATFGKDFNKISSFLKHKTAADCVEFYYKNHKSDWFMMAKKHNGINQKEPSSAQQNLITPREKLNSDVSCAKPDKLGKVSLIAAHSDDSILKRQSNTIRPISGQCSESKESLDDYECYDIGRNEREKVALDALACMCSSLSPDSAKSCITSEGYCDLTYQKVDSTTEQSLNINSDDETSSDESSGGIKPDGWKDEEKSAFVQAVAAYGKNFRMISRSVRTKSRDQCKVFFSKARGSLGLEPLSIGPLGVECQEVTM